MSDFRFTGRWLNDRRVMTLSGDDFKSWVTAGAWMVENRTDGRITADDLELVPRFTPSSIPRLVAAGLWVADGDSWVMTDYQETQTSRAEFEVLANARKRDREKKARQRAVRAEDSAHVPGDSPGDGSRGSTQDRTGQDRTGQEEGELRTTENVNRHTGEVMNWPTAVPGDPGYCTKHGVPWPCARHDEGCERAS
ncbi:hypothetical protein [Microbacterium sp. P5_E9]